ncbi:Hypothetical Protein FCC1311_098502 [Hondaea fermentalgiana]|uniref:Myb-like domain-containing protein n=1 Tax=Hondaea fermentalgiana TaxID=2315210 RepID=A0A2R5GRW9_9STRA|nr:Hypothetical Protein FCC1311_098502 [Hondaea fermentalgiana]|eukprot:GBG33627.1 Hypothetical Protein FCC1311_098502 [Hondaea fermentalgiana]
MASAPAAATAVLHSNDSRSLWNYTLSPGWTEKEVEVFRLALMKFGLGKWTDIVKAKCLPGKSVAQLNNQMQRMLGQQSTSEFTGLHIDPSRVFADNEKKHGRRKNGCLINMDGNMTQAQIKAKRAANEAKFGLDPVEIRNIVIPVLRHEDTSNVVNSSLQHKASMRRARYERLRQLERQLASLTGALERVRAGESAEVPEESTGADENAQPLQDARKSARPAAKKKPKSRAKKAKPRAKATPKTQEERDLELARMLQAEEEGFGAYDDPYGDNGLDPDFEVPRSKRRKTTKRRSRQTS